MSARCSARVAELQQPQALLGPLEGDFAKAFVGSVLSSLPLDERLRAREVCSGWRGFLEDVRFWTHINLSESCGVNPRFLKFEVRALALLRAACARAKGNLQSVDLSGVAAGSYVDPFVLQWLDSASAANKASLRDLVAPTSDWLDHEQVTALCRALPLCRVRCSVNCSPVEVLPLLRREPPFALLTMGNLCVCRMEDGELLDLASALSVYKGMRELTIYAEDAPLTTRAAVDALVNAAISAGIKDMSFCGLTQTALPALTRLIQSPGFERLDVFNNGIALFEGSALPAFFEALRNCTSLRTLGLNMCNLLADLAVASQLFDALEGHPALQKLCMHNEAVMHGGVPAMQRAAGECLARLIARSSSLRFLHLSRNALGEAGLEPIFEALRGHSGLVELTLWEEQISADFARDVVLPWVRTNTSLRKLEGLDVEEDVLDEEEDEPLPAMQEVEDILEARRNADKDADV